VIKAGLRFFHQKILERLHFPEISVDRKLTAERLGDVEGES